MKKTKLAKKYWEFMFHPGRKILTFKYVIAKDLDEAVSKLSCKVGINFEDEDERKKYHLSYCEIEKGDGGDWIR